MARFSPTGLLSHHGLAAAAAVAAGADGVFLEFHTNPDEALCDAPSCLPIDEAKGLLSELSAIRKIISA